MTMLSSTLQPLMRQPRSIEVYRADLGVDDLRVSADDQGAREHAVHDSRASFDDHRLVDAATSRPSSPSQRGAEGREDPAVCVEHVVHFSGVDPVAVHDLGVDA